MPSFLDFLSQEADTWTEELHTCLGAGAALATFVLTADIMACLLMLLPAFHTDFLT